MLHIGQLGSNEKAMNYEIYASHVACQNKIRGFEKSNLEFFFMGKVKDELVEFGVSHVHQQVAVTIN